MFHKLEKPFQNNAGKSRFNGMWCAVVEPYTRRSCLTVSGRVQLLDGPDFSKFYFDKESSCHYSAAMYYIQHGHTYPYLAEWHDAIERDVAAVNNAVGHRDGTVIQSEEFKF